MNDRQTICGIPTRCIGPVLLTGPVVEDRVWVPLATFERPLWPSVRRGARVAELAGGIGVVAGDEHMARSVLVTTPSALQARELVCDLRRNEAAVAEQAESTSRFARFAGLHCEQVANRVFVRLAMTTGDASGQNMITKAADHVLAWLLERYPHASYGSVSGNLCTDKKVSAVNGLLGRGRQVAAECVVPEAVCRRYLKTTPEAVARLNADKNLLGSILAGSVRSANAHFANMLLAVYLATGQDAANIVEGSQGFTTADVVDAGLYFAVTLPNLVVGTAGSGKDLPFAQEHLRSLGCLEDRPPGENARRLAAVIGATVWCGELSLLAALTRPGELMTAHQKYERDGHEG